LAVDYDAVSIMARNGAVCAIHLGSSYLRTAHYAPPSFF
jgi:hypothetical protein